MSSAPPPPPWHYPIWLSALAGSATGVGGLIVYLLEDVSDRSVALALSFAAGTMTCLSVFDLLLPMALRGAAPLAWAAAWALVGALLAKLLLRLPVPEPEVLLARLWGAPPPPPMLPSAAAPGAPPPAEKLEKQRHSAWRVGCLCALILTAHNLPEGLAVAAGANKSPQLGLAVTAAIFFHNVAEGVVVAVPLMRGLPSRRLAVCVAAATGLSEPLGALLGVVVLRSWVSAEAMGTVVDAALALVAGVMILVSAQELMPLAARHAQAEPSPARLLAAGAAAGALSIGATLFFI